MLSSLTSYFSLKLGNWCINNEAGQTEYKEKVKDYYTRSQYKWIESFIKDHPDWSERDIEDRATMMAETFYHFILRFEKAAPEGTAN